MTRYVKLRLLELNDLQEFVAEFLLVSRQNQKMNNMWRGLSHCYPDEIYGLAEFWRTTGVTG